VSPQLRSLQFNRGRALLLLKRRTKTHKDTDNFVTYSITVKHLKSD
jgi:hypothetical protein